ncbi:hypothetical protein CEXT_469101 [Caerostris extrusa]|uniref:Uncharacterized protein n=1 Tax=Caerostris extrusa TaxID=172846 RepID=A0AAV4XMP1_CAEEX|nr:hypothetical protein CEXT_469101 [Caerostris extrusa]
MANVTPRKQTTQLRNCVRCPALTKEATSNIVFSEPGHTRNMPCEMAFPPGQVKVVTEKDIFGIVVPRLGRSTPFA